MAVTILTPEFGPKPPSPGHNYPQVDSHIMSAIYSDKRNNYTRCYNTGPDRSPRGNHEPWEPYPATTLQVSFWPDLQNSGEHAKITT